MFPRIDGLLVLIIEECVILECSLGDGLAPDKRFLGICPKKYARNWFGKGFVTISSTVARSLFHLDHMQSFLFLWSMVID